MSNPSQLIHLSDGDDVACGAETQDDYATPFNFSADIGVVTCVDCLRLVAGANLGAADYAKSDERVIDDVLAHWFNQGGEQRFGPLTLASRNADGLVAALLPLLSRDAPTPETVDKRTTGLIHKFNVERTDGTSAPGKKHDGCDYFVLDLTHDPHAVPAIRAYADSCREDYPVLARDLDAKVPASSSVLLSREATKTGETETLADWRRQDAALQRIYGLCGSDASISCPNDVADVVEGTIASLRAVQGEATKTCDDLGHIYGAGGVCLMCQWPKPSGELDTYLKDGETVLQRLRRYHADTQSLLALLAKEKLRAERAELAAPADSHPSVASPADAPSPTTDWQDIATAPKDGTKVLIAWLDDAGEWQQRSAWFEREFNIEDVTDDDATIWRQAWTDNRVQSFGNEEVCEYLPTHWQPLPAPPLRRQEAQK